MEIVDIQLSELSFNQKLNLMEMIWDDLARDEKAIESPSWHEEILKDREKALAEGKTTVSNWEQATQSGGGGFCRGFGMTLRRGKSKCSP